VFVSPADRTLETARISLDAMQLDIEPIVQDEIQELSQGFAEGRLSAEIYTDEIRADIERLGKDFKLEGGESMNEVGQRMYQWVMKTFNREQVHGPQRHFIYTHGGAIKYLASHILGWDHERTYATEIDNTSVNLFTFQDNELSVAYLNREAEDI
jgi:broad specificity phosphatase PhoE